MPIRLVQSFWDEVTNKNSPTHSQQDSRNTLDEMSILLFWVCCERAARKVAAGTVDERGVLKLEIPDGSFRKWWLKGVRQWLRVSCGLPWKPYRWLKNLVGMIEANKQSKLNRFIGGLAYKLGSRAMSWARERSITEAWKNEWDETHFETLLRLRKSGFVPKVVIDVGANDGKWSEMCEEVFAPEKIFLIEPQPTLLRGAVQRSKRSGTVWKGLQFALGDQKGKHILNVTENEAAASLLSPAEGRIPESWGVKEKNGIEVEVVRLDDLFQSGTLPRAELVKIDIQGFEGKVLNGGATFIKLAEVLIVEVSLKEIYRGQPLMPEVLEQCRTLGYELFDITEASREWPGGVLWQVDLWLRRETGK